jgi:transcriptional regulator with XRE-family HTH domain
VRRTRGDDKELNRVFGQRLRELRKARRLSQEKLAELSGCHRNHISLMERGIWGASLYTVFQLAKGLDVPPGELVSEVAAKMEHQDQLPQEGG